MEVKRLILWGVVGVMAVLAVGSYIWSLRVGIDRVTSFKGRVGEGAHIFLPVKEYDFGVVKQSSNPVKMSFEVINDGVEDVIVNKVVASCSCTSGKINKDVIKPGESAFVIVTFDPNFHFESYEQIMRTVTIFSNTSNSPRPEIKIYVKVDYDLGADKTKYGKESD